MSTKKGSETPKLPYELEHPTKITLFKHPFITLKYFTIVVL